MAKITGVHTTYLPGRPTSATVATRATASSKAKVTRLDRTAVRGRAERGKYTLRSRYPEPTMLPVAAPTELLNRFHRVRPTKKYTAKGTGRASWAGDARRMNRKISE